MAEILQIIFIHDVYIISIYIYEDKGMFSHYLTQNIMLLGHMFNSINQIALQWSQLAESAPPTQNNVFLCYL